MSLRRYEEFPALVELFSEIIKRYLALRKSLFCSSSQTDLLSEAAVEHL